MTNPLPNLFRTLQAGLIALAVLAPLAAAPALAQQAGDLEALNLSLTGYWVYATAVQPDGKTIVAGDFTSVLGVARSNIARLNADGTLDASFDPKANARVHCVAVQPDGKVLLGGAFTTMQPNGAASPTARQYIARLNADGTLDAGFDPKANAEVFSVLPQPDGKVLLGGSFTTLQPNGAFGTTTRNRIARVNTDGTLDAGFDPKANHIVYSIALQTDGKVLLGGRFNSLQPNGTAFPTPRNRIARVNANGTLDTGFNPNAGGTVLVVAAQADGKILLGGDFTLLQPNGSGFAVTRNRIARVHSDGTLDTGFDPDANSTVTSLAVQADGKVLVGGYFSALPFGGGVLPPVTRNHVARVNADGTLDTGFNPNANGNVLNVVPQADGKVLLGGNFTTLQPNGAASATPRTLFARLQNDAASQTLSINGTTQADWQRGGAGPEVSRVTFELSTNGGVSWNMLGTGTRIVGGWQLTGLSLPSSGEVRARGVTSGSYSGGSSGLVETLLAFGGVAPEIAVEQPPGTIITDGAASVSFSSAPVGETGASLTFTIKNTGTASLTGLTIAKDGADAAMFAVTTATAPVSVGGSTTFTVRFEPTSPGPKSAAIHIASNDGDENPFDINLTGTGTISTNANLLALTASTGPLSPAFASGTLNYTASVPFATDSATITPVSISSTAAITVNGAVVASGNASAPIALNIGSNSISTFVTAGDGVTTKTYSITITRAAPAIGDVEALNLNLGGGAVFATAVQPDGKIIIGGFFTSVLGVWRSHLARINIDGTLDAGFDPSPDGVVYGVTVQADGKVLIGGAFSTLQPNGAAMTTPRGFIARVNSDGTLDMGFDPHADNAVFNMTMQNDGKIVLGGAFYSLQPNGAATATARRSIARVNADGTLDAGFDPNANYRVYSVAVQPDRKILLGGEFTTLQPNGSASPVARQYIARLNPDGTLDAGFDPKANSWVSSVALQADGKALLSGGFTTLQPNGAALPTTRSRIARLNTDGTLDTGFDPRANDWVNNVAVQADGKLLLSGRFTTLQPNGDASATARQYVARVNADGTLDTGFNPEANGYVYSLALQTDGMVLIGGDFTTLQPNGTPSPIPRTYFARLYNDAAVVTLSTPNAAQLLWQRGGAAPEVSKVSFDLATGAGGWTPLGAGTRIAGGWQITGLSLPANGEVRARGVTSGGDGNNSAGMVETIISFGPDVDSDGLLDTWELTYWPTTTGHSALDDSDHDGYVELLELAFGLNPTQPSAGGLPPTINEGGYLTMTITKQSGVTYEVQSAGTLLPALPDSFSASTTTVLINDATTLKVRDNFLISAAPGRFMRVKVTAAP